MIGGISFSATSVTSGLDADKPVNPRPGNQYLATDTRILYVCYYSGVWIDSSRISSGLDVYKPAIPRPGNQYLATDTRILYICYYSGVWVDSSRVTSGLDVNKPANPRPGNQYITTDTKKQYNCYIQGVWVDVAPPITAYGDITMVVGTDETLFSDTNVRGFYVQNTNYYTIHQYTVGDINRFFTEVQSFNISCDLLRDGLGGSTTCIVKINGDAKMNNVIENNGNSWVTVAESITAELKSGDIIEVGMSYSMGNTTKELRYRNFTIKCATPTFKPKVSLPLN